MVLSNVLSKHGQVDYVRIKGSCRLPHLYIIFNIEATLTQLAKAVAPVHHYHSLIITTFTGLEIFFLELSTATDKQAMRI